jgi:DNA-binding protein WhiA
MTWSHSRVVKAELARLPITSRSQAVSELRGIVDVSGGAGTVVRVGPTLARRVYRLGAVLGTRPELRHGEGRARVAVTLAAPLPDRVPNPRAYLRGAFLARGYVADPDRAYHVELVAPTRDVARRLQAALERLGLTAAVAPRRGGLAVYLKSQDQVAQFLAQIGAHQARLGLASRQVVKAVRNQVNRVVNGETANLRRAAETGYDQAARLRPLLADGAGRGWPAPLLAVAELRVAHPEWTLDELGQHLDPPLSKSGVAHRLRRLLGESPPDA